MRRVEAAGGFVMVLRKGDPISGAILIQLLDRAGGLPRILERIPDFSGGYRMEEVAAKYRGDAQALTQYLDRRTRSDPDLWLVELDVADGERFAAETFAGG
jgi:hypothetical protein